MSKGKNQKQLQIQKIAPVTEFSEITLKGLRYIGLQPRILPGTGSNSGIHLDQLYLVIERALSKGFSDGMEAQRKYNDLPITRLRDNALAILCAAMCESGLETCEVIRHYERALASAITDFRNTLRTMDIAEPRLKRNDQAIDEIINFCSRVLTLAGNYVSAVDAGQSIRRGSQENAGQPDENAGKKAQTLAREAKNNLRAFAAANHETFLQLWQNVQLANHRGDKADLAYRYIGECALEKQGKGWEIGQEIYQNLKAIRVTPSDEQKLAAEKLKEYMLPDKDVVAAEQRTEIGTYIMRARRDAEKRKNNSHFMELIQSRSN